MNGQVEAHVLGPVRLVVDGTVIEPPGRRQRRLLGALLAGGGAVVSTDALVEAVFDGAPPACARATCHTYIARLRRTLDAAGAIGVSIVRTAPPGYRLDTDAVTLDADVFAREVADARQRLAAGDADGAVTVLDRALRRRRGPAYAELASEPWAEAEAVRLDQLWLLARQLRAEALLDAGCAGAAVAELEALVRDDRLGEEPRRLLLVALHRSGRRAEALRAASAYRRLLAEETGLEPSAELDRLEHLVLAGDAHLDNRPGPGRDYEFVEPLCRTPPATTYRARHGPTAREVAVTVFPAEPAADPGSASGLDARTREIAAVEHPNVVPLYDYWRDTDAAYVVTRHLSRTLADRLAAGDPVPAAWAVRVVRDIGGALAAAHGRGVVHGGLTPEHVHLDEAGVAYITLLGHLGTRCPVTDDVAALAVIARTIADRVDRGPSDRRPLAPADAGPDQRSVDDRGDVDAITALVEAFAASLGAGAAPIGA